MGLTHFPNRYVYGVGGAHHRQVVLVEELFSRVRFVREFEHVRSMVVFFRVALVVSFYSARSPTGLSMIHIDLFRFGTWSCAFTINPAVHRHVERENVEMMLKHVTVTIS